MENLLQCIKHTTMGLPLSFPHLYKHFQVLNSAYKKMVLGPVGLNVCSIDALFVALVLGKIRQCPYKLTESEDGGANYSTHF